MLFTLRQNLIHFIDGQILMIIKPDLHHRCCAATPETFDHSDGKFAVIGRSAGVDAEFAANMIGDLRLAHDLARQRLAYLDVMAADRMQIEHRIKRRRFPNIRYLEI